MWPTSAIVATIALTLLCMGLGFACRRLAIAADHRDINQWALGLQRDLQHASDLLSDQLDALAQVGELLDHAGVDLEKTSHQQESTDLKALGGILRTRRHRGEWFEPESAQAVLRELGDRYGIEPKSGGPYSVRNAIRIAEEIIERLLPVR